MEFGNPESRNYGITEFGTAELRNCIIGINCRPRFLYIDYGPKIYVKRYDLRRDLNHKIVPCIFKLSMFHYNDFDKLIRFRKSMWNHIVA